VRPRRLTMRGLRSYRSECTIDFRDRGLVAIVGDTGAGKSSILEAITYALYNATTWDQRASQLISDGAQTMSVELEFEAGDRVWSVHRASHRAAGRASTHRLRCLSDRSVADCDGEAAVNRQVERLLGMSYRAYLAAVVLPQGRFQTLLQETPAKRTAILEGIFRLTDLRAVQKAARELGDRAGAATRDLTTRRAVLLADPAGTVATLAAEVEELRRRESVLLELAAAAGRTREAVRTARERAAALRAHAGLVTAADGGAAGHLGDLLPLAAALGAELAEASAAEAYSARRAEAAGAAAAAGERVEDLAAGTEQLRSVRQALAELEAAGVAAERERADLDADAAALATGESGLPALEEAAGTAGAAAAAAAAAVEDQRDLARRVREALRAARSAAAERDAAAGDERARRDAVPAAAERLAESRRLAEEAGHVLEARRAALEEAQRRDAAAHTAEGLRPGDPCPVCGRPLGAGFQPPAGGALDPLKRAVREAQAALTDRRAAETTAANLLDEAERRLAEAAGRRSAAEGAVGERLADLRTAAPAADLGLDDAALLRPVDDRGRELAAAAAAVAKEAEAARDRLAAARADLQARRGDLDRRLDLHQHERRRAGEKRAACAARLRALPGALAVAVAARAADLDPGIAAAERRLDEARRRRAELDAVRAEAVRLARARSDLQARLRDELERPRSAAMARAAQLRMRVDDGLGAVGRPPVEPPPAEAGLEAEARWAAELERGAGALLRLLEEAVAEAGRAEAEAGAELGRRLADHGLPDAEAVDAGLRRARLDLGRVESEMRTAEAQIPRAAELDGWIATGTEIRDSLSELARLLQDAQFIGHVIERRQRQLLVVASQILGSMTGDAYGFAADFEIVDRATNQPRPTRTLSGGETFLASLALALALVEIAGRSGTQLDALFLDEGFGSLDANALDDALSALELQASGGRLVAVVSHVRAVAERIETVLEVTRTAAGSRAEWRDGTERELLLSAELERRLLA